eukprot:gene10879-biopygen10255
MTPTQEVRAAEAKDNDPSPGNREAGGSRRGPPGAPPRGTPTAPTPAPDPHAVDRFHVVALIQLQSTPIKTVIGNFREPLLYLSPSGAAPSRSSHRGSPARCGPRSGEEGKTVTASPIANGRTPPFRQSGRRRHRGEQLPARAPPGASAPSPSAGATPRDAVRSGPRVGRGCRRPAAAKAMTQGSQSWAAPIYYRGFPAAAQPAIRRSFAPHDRGGRSAGGRRPAGDALKGARVSGDYRFAARSAQASLDDCSAKELRRMAKDTEGVHGSCR